VAARRFALYAFAKFIDGTEKAYMVEAAISDLERAYGSHAAADLARKALQDEEKRDELMALALTKLPACP